jgi:hypothetical protein
MVSYGCGKGCEVGMMCIGDGDWKCPICGRIIAFGEPDEDEKIGNHYPLRSSAHHCIYWVSDNGDTKLLYWAGSFVAPTTVDEPYVWTSENDHNKTDNAMLASSDDTKTMTYQSGVLNYEASALGTTTTIKLEKQK